MATITSRATADTAPKVASLLELPPELRVRIYQYALKGANLMIRRRVTSPDHTLDNA
ncbi:hypothetical protein LTR08_008855 [Meristemomyces frigidus]|nr:hypothetical protein LTR08_008855 [Meristemomyces frigidus]